MGEIVRISYGPAFADPERMTNVRARFVVCSSIIGLLALIGQASAMQAPADPPAAAPTTATSSTGSPTQAAPEDDAILQPAEPEFRLINVPTTELLPKHKSSFELTHRFGGNLRRGSFADNAKSLFGLDQGAAIGLEYRFAVARHLQAAIYRTSIDRTIQFHAKYDALRQSAAFPVALSGLVSIEATDNFTDEKTPMLGAVVSRMFDEHLAFYAAPIWVHNSAPGIGSTRNTFMVGTGGRVRIRPTVYVSVEVSPRLAGYQPGPPEYGFAIEKRAGGHMFQLNFTNTTSSTYGQVARGGFDQTLYLGFNLARKFY
jgi:hypothetical protein